MTNINEELNNIKKQRESRKAEDKLIDKIDKLSKLRDKQQKVLESIELKIKTTFDELTKLTQGA
ncbi:Uncharacterised protein [Helicobacter fennelliae]|uniref:Uncharacterized protein n=1 Tax=Helicobacter fennelliae TaxID=215 RepID=A0A2X3GH79_9HELI|nr:hypothetical protein [Helicobacter fennelliae]SQC36309.1 Uncharacterised protein [Helicobacter fennelliae]